MNDNIKRICKTFSIILLILVVHIFPIVSPMNIITQKIKISHLVIRVDDDGDGDYTNIQDAIDNASNGDTIEVYSGKYIDMNVSINKYLKLKGINMELGGGNSSGKPLIIGEIDHQPNIGLITVLEDNCSVSGFHLKEKENSFCKAGIAILSNNTDIFQNDVEDTNSGITIYWDTSNNRVYNNTFPKCSIGISSHSPYSQIYNNYITNHLGISISAESNSVYNNIINGSSWHSIHITNANNLIIKENIIMNCKIGVYLWIDPDSSMNVFYNNISNCDKGIFVEGNSFTDKNKFWENNISSCGTGIDISADENLIYKNDISFCNNGIKLSGQDHLIYQNNILRCEESGIILDAGYTNVFENNIGFNKEYGIYLSKGRYNHIYHNNFINNSVNAFCDYYYPTNPFEDYNQWNLDYSNDGGGNYWSDYNGKDTNGDGIGDKSYPIPDDFPNPLTNDKDKYPLIEPDGRPNSRAHPINRYFLIISKFLECFPRLERLLNLLR